MKKCELCNSVARMYCDSDQASLCWDCDSRVHTANFLVAKHCRTLLCHVCQSPTPWTASGPRLSPVFSLCPRCDNSNNNSAVTDDRHSQNDREDDDDDESDRNDDEDDEEDDDDDDDDDGDNQVVPLASTSVPSVASSSSSREESSSNRSSHQRRLDAASSASVDSRVGVLSKWC